MPQVEVDRLQADTSHGCQRPEPVANVLACLVARWFWWGLFLGGGFWKWQDQYVFRPISRRLTKRGEFMVKFCNDASAIILRDHLVCDRRLFVTLSTSRQMHHKGRMIALRALETILGELIYEPRYALMHPGFLRFTLLDVAYVVGNCIQIVKHARVGDDAKMRKAVKQQQRGNAAIATLYKMSGKRMAL
jgi:hypothetical protein